MLFDVGDVLVTLIIIQCKYVPKDYVILSYVQVLYISRKKFEISMMCSPRKFFIVRNRGSFAGNIEKSSI